MSATGRYSMLWLASAAVGILLSSDRRGFAVFATGIVVEWFVTNGPVKMLFQRKRPDNSDVAHLIPAWLHPPRSSSFPSGHSSAAAFATVIWWSWSPITGVICAVVAIAMALSRVILRAHHRTDVAAGLLWGAALAGLAIVLLGARLPS